MLNSTSDELSQYPVGLSLRGSGSSSSLAVATPRLPPIEAEFGVVIAVAPQHLHWAKGTCASVRYFMDDTPIWLLLDGEADTGSLERTYGVNVLRRAEVGHPELVRLSFYSLSTKSAALWLAPFETYLFVDADAVVWGDMRQHADFDHFDFILNTPIGDPEQVRNWVMDAEAAHSASLTSTRRVRFALRQHRRLLGEARRA